MTRWNWQRARPRLGAVGGRANMVGTAPARDCNLDGEAARHLCRFYGAPFCTGWQALDFSVRDRVKPFEDPRNAQCQAGGEVLPQRQAELRPGSASRERLFKPGTRAAALTWTSEKAVGNSLTDLVLPPRGMPNTSSVQGGSGEALGGRAG